MGKRQGKRQSYYQYDLEDVYGKRWQSAPLNPYLGDGQLNIEDVYDASILGEETEEERVRRQMKDMGVCKIMRRTIMSGNHIETEIHPVYLNRKDAPRADKLKPSRDAQKKLNKKNSIKNLIRLMHCNFDKGDLLVTLTYKDGYFPDIDRARKDVHNYLTAISRYRKKQGLPELKYIYVIEYVPEGAQTKKVRIHHHIIMSGMDRDIAESKWKKGRCHTRYVEPDEDFGLEGFARYVTKLEADGRHSYQPSRNLKKPTVHESVTALTRKKMRDLVMSGDKLPETMEALYRGTCRHIDTKIYYSDWVGGFYIYSRLKKREVEIVGDKENALSDSNLMQAKIYMDFEWEGSLSNGTAIYSTVREAVVRGIDKTKEDYRIVKQTTKNRAVLIQLIQALEHFNKGPCQIEVHTSESYLASGFNLNRFNRARKSGYKNVKNADLIEKLLTVADMHKIKVVPERTNKYSEAERIQRKEKRTKMEVITDER